MKLQLSRTTGKTSFTKLSYTGSTMLINLKDAPMSAGYILMRLWLKILCKLRECKKFKTCKQKTDPFKNNKLCWGYENYINQDVPKNLRQYEVLFSEINFNLDRINAQLFEPLPSNKKKEIIKMFFFGKSNINDIANCLQCSPQYIYTILKNCKNILLESIKK